MIPHEEIRSAANPRVRQASLLRDANARRETGLTLIDGRRELATAVAKGVAIVELFLDAEMLRASSLPASDPLKEQAFVDWLQALVARGTQILALSRKAFERIAFGGRNEGCVGVARYSAPTLDQLTVAECLPVLLVEGVEKPGNLGAILRTADASGIGGVIVCDGRTDPANPAVIRASLGTVFAVPLAVASTQQGLDWCRLNGRRIVAAMPAGESLWYKTDLVDNVAILLGSEAHGISPLWQQAAASGVLRFLSVRLPMVGRADSLNVSATAAVLAYEALRQREQQV